MMSFSALEMSSRAEEKKFNEGKAVSPSRPGEVYFLKGPIMRTRAWEAKRLEVLEGRNVTVDLNHAELNGWLSGKFRPAAAPSDEVKTNVLIIPGVPNVYVDTDVIHFSLPTEVILFGTSYKYTVLGTGTFGRWRCDTV